MFYTRKVYIRLKIVKVTPKILKVQKICTHEEKNVFIKFSDF